MLHKERVKAAALPAEGEQMLWPQAFFNSMTSIVISLLNVPSHAPVEDR